MGIPPLAVKHDVMFQYRVFSLSMKLYKYSISFGTSSLRKWMLMLSSWNFYTAISLIEVMRGGSQ